MEERGEIVQNLNIHFSPDKFTVSKDKLHEYNSDLNIGSNSFPA